MPMLKTKITVCAILFLAIIAIGAVLHIGVQRDRFHYFMKLPIPDGSFRIYKSDTGERINHLYTPYLPREYVKIVDIEQPSHQD